MSFFNENRNKVRVEAFAEPFTTSVVNFNPGDTRGLVIIRAVIDNQDSANAVTFQKNGQGGITYTIPANSVGVIENEVMTSLRIVPDGTTGAGFLSGELAKREELTKGGFLRD